MKLILFNYNLHNTPIQNSLLIPPRNFLWTTNIHDALLFVNGPP